VSGGRRGLNGSEAVAMHWLKTDAIFHSSKTGHIILTSEDVAFLRRVHTRLH
jgi:hypothetical protein